MVERAAAGEMPSSPQPPEAGAHKGQALRRLVRRRVSELEDNAVELVRCRPVNVAALDPASADPEHVVDLPLAAWRGLAASLCAIELALSDMREDGCTSRVSIVGAANIDTRGCRANAPAKVPLLCDLPTFVMVDCGARALPWRAA
jgi:hypothetical protein